MTSGPVLAGGSTYFPVNQDEFATTRDYEASIYSLGGTSGWSEVGDAPLNRGVGSAQTDLFAVGNRVWAIWSELKFTPENFGQLIPTAFFAARVDESGTGYDRVLNLWRGEMIFPSTAQVVQYRGGPAFLYARQFGKNDGIHATVSFWRRRSTN